LYVTIQTVSTVTIIAITMFDTEVNMLLVLGECQKNYRRAAVMFFERYGIKKSHVSFYNLEKRLREHGKLRTTTVASKLNTVISFNRNI